MNPANIIWLATYPKSGTTWIRSLLTAVSQPGNALDINALGIPSAANRSFIEQCLGLKASDFRADEIRQWLPTAFRHWSSTLERPRLLKTHDARLGSATNAQDIFPLDATHGVILVVRDPRDVAVSSRHYFNVTQDEAIDHLNDRHCWLLHTRPYLQLPTYLSDWSSHTASWLDAPMRRLVVRYEDLLEDTLHCLRKILDFCNIEIPEHIAAQAVRVCEFKSLQQQERHHGYSAHAAGRQASFFRSGRQGQWREALTKAQTDRIVQAHDTVMRRCGYIA